MWQCEHTQALLFYFCICELNLALLVTKLLHILLVVKHFLSQNNSICKICILSLGANDHFVAKLLIGLHSMYFLCNLSGFCKRSFLIRLEA